MKYFYDCEFLEDGKTVDLISIGIYAEDGRTFYAVSNEFDTRRVAKNDWLMKNVMSSIDHESFVVTDFQGDTVRRDIYVTDPAAMSRLKISNRILEFIGRTFVDNDGWSECQTCYYRGKPGTICCGRVRGKDYDPELWAWYSAYDHICLAQLFGQMVNLPVGVPMWTNDIKTLHKMAGYPPMPKQPEGLHNALEDAKFNKVRYDFLEAKIKCTT